jgi:hypothetical protein
MEVSDVSADVITHTEPDAPQSTCVIGGNIQLTCIIVKSRWPGVKSRTVVVPTLNGVLSDERKTEIILAERQKMAEEAAALAAVDISGEEAPLDPELTDRAGGGGGVQLLGHPGGEGVGVEDVVTGGDGGCVGVDRFQGDGAGEVSVSCVGDEGRGYE